MQDAMVLGIVAAPAAYLFLAIMHREVLMDINDTRGDQEAGVRTLPVVFGRKVALGVAAALCAAASGIAAHAALAGNGLAWLVRACMTGVRPYACAMVGVRHCRKEPAVSHTTSPAAAVASGGLLAAPCQRAAVRHLPPDPAAALYGNSPHSPERL